MVSHVQWFAIPVVSKLRWFPNSGVFQIQWFHDSSDRGCIWASNNHVQTTVYSTPGLSLELGSIWAQMGTGEAPYGPHIGPHMGSIWGAIWGPYGRAYSALLFFMGPIWGLWWAPHGAHMGPVWMCDFLKRWLWFLCPWWINNDMIYNDRCNEHFCYSYISVK